MAKQGNHTGNPRVSLVKVQGGPPFADITRIYEAVVRATELLGGFGSIVTPGDSVLIKPNLVMPLPYTSGATTNPAVVRALVRLAKEFGAGRICIAESCEVGLDTAKIFAATGIDAVAAEENVELIDLKKDEPVAVLLPGAELLRRFFLPKSVVAADVIINVPVIKTHTEFPVTLGMKNMKGVLYDADKRKLHRKGLTAGIVDLYRAVRPEFTVADGTVAMEGFGPICGDPVNLGLIAASTDTMACDAVCCAVMGIDPLSVEYISAAYGLGLGEAVLSRITVVGEDIAEVRRPFKRRTFADVVKGGWCGIIDQNACSGCHNAMATMINQLEKDNALRAIAECVFVFGQKPERPEPGQGEGKRLIFIGKCQRGLAKEGEKYFPGCPPGGIRMADELSGKDKNQGGCACANYPGSAGTS